MIYFQKFFGLEENDLLPEILWFRRKLTFYKKIGKGVLIHGQYCTCAHTFTQKNCVSLFVILFSFSV